MKSDIGVSSSLDVVSDCKSDEEADDADDEKKCCFNWRETESLYTYGLSSLKF